jgi:hypothetical protein
MSGCNTVLGIQTLANEAADAGVSEPTGAALHGTLIDQTRQPVPNAELRVGNQTTHTDPSGKFTLAHADNVYDAVVTLHRHDEQGNDCTAVWLYEGMTRRAPVFQVQSGLDTHSASYRVQVRAPAFPLPDNQFLYVALGHSQHAFHYNNLQKNDVALDAAWEGASDQLDATLHAVQLSLNRTAQGVSVLGQESVPISIGGDMSSAELSVPNARATTLEVSGHVSAQGQRKRNNSIWFRWNDEARMDLIDYGGPSDDFTYTIPVLPDGGADVVATEGDFANPPYAAAVVENIMNARPDISIEIPAPAAISLPANNEAAVDGATQFQWSGNAPVFRLDVASQDDCAWMSVVTARKEVTLPVSPRSSYHMAPHTKFLWQVSTNGEESSVDEASNLAGYDRPFHYGISHGADRALGSMTISERRAFVSGP